jgi:serine/threonine protein kinase
MDNEIFHHDHNIYIVMEYCRGGSLLTSKVRRLSEAKTAIIMGKLLSIARYLHNRRMVHGDLTLENILWEDGSPMADVKLVDFGRFRFHHETQSTRIRQELAAPETMDQHHGMAADMWSLGIIAFTLMNGRPPPSTTTPPHEVLWQVDVSDDAKAFVRNLLECSPVDRMASYNAQRHTWITRLD